MTVGITSYEFGRIVVDGQAHTSDLIIHPGGIEGSWRRREGHRLHPQDLESVWASAPSGLIVGTGYYGRMTVPDGTREEIEGRGVELHAVPTGEAVDLYNRLASNPDLVVVAALHLTC